MMPGELKARFVRDVGNPQPDTSFWEVLETDRSLLKISVKEIMSRLPLTYEQIATKEFGTILLQRVRRSLNETKRVAAARKAEKDAIDNST